MCTHGTTSGRYICESTRPRGFDDRRNYINAVASLLPTNGFLGISHPVHAIGTGDYDNRRWGFSANGTLDATDWLLDGRIWDTYLSHNNTVLFGYVVDASGASPPIESSTTTAVYHGVSESNYFFGSADILVRTGLASQPSEYSTLTTRFEQNTTDRIVQTILFDATPTIGTFPLTDWPSTVP